LPLLFRDALATHLPCHVAVDGGDSGLDPVGGEIVELDVEPRERADMGDAATHLPRADYADLANMNGRVAGTGLRPLFDLNHALSPALPSACGQSRVALFLTSNFAEFSRQFRKRLIQIGDEPNVGHLKDGRLFVLVDGHNDLRILHTGEMLDRAGNPDRDVKLRRHDLARLADLPVVGGIAGINRGPRGA